MKIHIIKTIDKKNAFNKKGFCCVAVRMYLCGQFLKFVRVLLPYTGPSETLSDHNTIVVTKHFCGHKLSDHKTL